MDWRRIATWALRAAGVAAIVLIIVFPPFALFLHNWNWFLGLATGWLWRDGLLRPGNRTGGGGVERVMADRAKALKRSARLSRFFRRS